MADPANLSDLVGKTFQHRHVLSVIPRPYGRASTHARTVCLPCGRRQDTIIANLLRKDGYGACARCGGLFGNGRDPYVVNCMQDAPIEVLLDAYSPELSWAEIGEEDHLAAIERASLAVDAVA